jgi:hypothetical protein
MNVCLIDKGKKRKACRSSERRRRKFGIIMMMMRINEVRKTGFAQAKMWKGNNNEVRKSRKRRKRRTDLSYLRRTFCVFLCF